MITNMNPSDIENEKQQIMHMIEIYKQNNVPEKIYFPVLFRLKQLQNPNPQPLPPIKPLTHDIIIQIEK